MRATVVDRLLNFVDLARSQEELEYVEKPVT
jgi:hypothetical protein